MLQLRKTGENVKIKRILVYGPIGSGKSSLLELFKERGAFTVDCDRIAHKILENDLEVSSILKQHFGSSVFENGKISRKNLANKVFFDPASLFFLEDLILPRVVNEVNELYNQQKNASHSAFVVEASNYPKVRKYWENFFDQKIAVVAPLDVRLQRALKMGMSSEEFHRRSSFQNGEQYFQEDADLILNNNLTIKELKQQFLNKVAT